MVSETQRVLLVDDHPLLRHGVRQLLSLEPGLEVVAEAGSGLEGLELARQLHPDLVLLDLNMPHMDGLATLKAMRADDSLDGRIVVYTVSDQEEDVLAALRAGADGYLLKDMPPLEMLEALRAVAQGRLSLSERLTELLARALRQESPERNAQRAGLTERESEIVGCIAQGRSNKWIARDLQIAEGTVKVHLKNILKKLELNSRVEVAVWAVRSGWKIAH